MMPDGALPPTETVDLGWLETHLASLRREIAGQSEPELRKAAQLAIAAGDDALEQGDLRRAALQYTTASLLVELVRSRTKTD